MEYNDILQRYFQAQTTPAEEQQLAEKLAEKQNLTAEERVAKAMMAAAEVQRQRRVAVSLHQPAQRVSRWKVAVAAMADLSCIILSEGVVLDANALERAEQNDIPVLSSAMTTYETCVAISKAFEK